MRIAFGMIVGAVIAIGCGKPKADYSLVDLVDGQGTVTLDGQPLAGAVVTFEDPVDGTFSYGLTDAEGNYVMQFDSEMQGVKTGKKIVRISTSRVLLGLNSPPGQADESEDGSGTGAGAEEQVPARYNRDSELTIEVTPESGSFDFALTRA